MLGGKVIDTSQDWSFVRLDEPTGRVYVSPDGQRYVSVTTILRKTAVKSAGLVKWSHKMRTDPIARWEKIKEWVEKGKLNKEIADQAIVEDWPIERVTEYMMRAGAKRGTEMHVGIENFFKSNRRVEGTGPYWDSVRPFLERITSEHPLSEYHTYHKVLRYAGTTDMLAEVEFNPAIIDWKTADDYKNPEWISDYFLQVAAYAAAVRSMHGIKVEHGYIVIAVPNRPAQILPLTPETLRKWWTLFQARLRMYRASCTP